MDHEFIMLEGGRSTGRLVRTPWARRLRTGTARSRHPTHDGSDKVSLSSAYTVIQAAEMELRIENLELQVAQRSYWPPAAIISRDLIAEHLAA